MQKSFIIFPVLFYVFFPLFHVLHMFYAYVNFYIPNCYGKPFLCNFYGSLLRPLPFLVHPLFPLPFPYLPQCFYSFLLVRNQNSVMPYTNMASTQFYFTVTNMEKLLQFLCRIYFRI